ncbi:MAG: c-type cytochrome biogenesis protein CcmI, partial [Thiobacillus sp.]|nr:c-type cytochrome biogenesis protein CcmI [Thiobacillus sp.]
MTLFWIICAVLLLLALPFVVLPLWRGAGKDNAGSNDDEVLRDAANLEILRDQSAELEADLRNGLLTQDAYEQGTRELQARRALPQVEIVGVDLVVDGVSARVVRERTGFSIAVEVFANRMTDIADVSIKIMRSDGVYVYWQSSGMVGANLRDFSGRRVLHFDFSSNELGAGSYQVSAYTANGWDYPGNYPYS